MSRWRGSRKTRKQSRTNQLPFENRGIRPEQVDDGLYRCWNCKMICDENREVLGGPDEINAVGLQSYQSNPDPGDGDPLSGIVVLGGATASVIGMELGGNGEPQEIRHDLQPVVSSGCPFCGTKNWRGDY